MAKLVKKKLISSFSLLELIFIIAILSVILSITTIKREDTNLQDAVKRLKLYLNYTRYIAHIDNKFDINDSEWEKKLWTLKFKRCSQSVGGLYFVVYSDKSGGTAHFKKEECLKDPLTNKYLYSNYDCEASFDESKYILLTKQYGVERIEISCNTTDAIGQISFGYDGKIYSQLGTNPKIIDSKCTIKVYDKNDRFETISIEPNTGYIE